jgi:predicted transcriptional regulator
MKKILSNLIYLYNKNERPLQASEVAQTTGLTVGTIRNHMQILKMLEMIKGITGQRVAISRHRKLLKLLYLIINQTSVSI